jgi:5-methylthioadenosine/S-adenosylhomocysteine deaminase
VVYAMGRESVEAVWVNGRQVVREGAVLTVDEEKVRHAAQEAAIAVARRAEG